MGCGTTDYTFTIYAAPLTVDLIGGNGSLVGSGNISLTLWVNISLKVPRGPYPRPLTSRVCL